MEASKSTRLGIVGVGLLLVHGSSLDVCAVDFIRGDANSDGVVSFADGEAVQGYLFRFKDLSCLDAADANDSGDVDIADVAAIWTHVIDGTYDPPSPFPELGPDPTPGSPDWPSGCDGYGDGTVLD